MLTRRLKERTPSAQAVGTAYVEGRNLTFTKESKDGSGKCDIEQADSREARVWGVLFRIDSSESELLDSAEGLRHGYRSEHILTVLEGGTMSAVAYFATKTNKALRPYDWYKALVLAGAIEHQLPEEYVSKLREIPAEPDPDVSRRQKNEALLKNIG